MLVRAEGTVAAGFRVIEILDRDVAHAERRMSLQGALAQDVMRRDFGYRPRVFRDTLRAMLTQDTRRP